MQEHKRTRAHQDTVKVRANEAKEKERRLGGEFQYTKKSMIRKREKLEVHGVLTPFSHLESGKLVFANNIDLANKPDLPGGTPKQPLPPLSMVRVIYEQVFVVVWHLHEVDDGLPDSRG